MESVSGEEMGDADDEMMRADKWKANDEGEGEGEGDGDGDDIAVSLFWLFRLWRMQRLSSLVR